MWISMSSITLNLILFTTMIFVNRKEKRKREKIKMVKAISDNLLNEQIDILRRGDYKTNSLELEIAKYIRDVLLRCMINGELDELEKSRLHGSVLEKYPDIFVVESIKP